jgi:hypothetical protein
MSDIGDNSTINDHESSLDSFSDYSTETPELRGRGDERQAAPEQLTESRLHPAFIQQLGAETADVSSASSPGSSLPTSVGGSSSTDSWEKTEEQDLVAVGRDLSELRFLLTGSRRSSSRWRVRLWGSAVLVTATASSVIVIGATDPALIGPSVWWQRMGYLAAMIWPACGWIATEVTILMAESLPEPLTDQSLLRSDSAAAAAAADGQAARDEQASARDEQAVALSSGADTRKDRFMSSLLNCKVTAGCANSISTRAKIAVLQMLGPFGVFLYFILIMTKDQAGTLQTYLAALLACISWPAACLQLAGWLVYLQVPAAIGCDLIKQAERQVRRMVHSTCSWNQVMHEVQSCHEITVCLSALLNPVMIANAVISWLFILIWIGALVCPRGGDLFEHSWLVDWVPTWVLLIAIYALFVNMMLPLFAGARCSSACDGLVQAITDLRYEERQEEPPPPPPPPPSLPLAGGGPSSSGSEDGSDGNGGASNGGGGGGGNGGGSRNEGRLTRRRVMVCANPENLIRLNGILQYAFELNRSQGVGFTLRSKRM